MKSSILKVLVVDDQQWMRSIVRVQLKNFGIEQVFEADCGSGAFEMVETGKVMPDVVLCDLHMENGDGIMFINSLRRHEVLKHKHIPVILITGESDELLLEVAKQVGAVCVLIKPFSPDALAKAISKAIGYDITGSHGQHEQLQA